MTLEITNPYDRLIFTENRTTSLKYLIGEWLWYLRGANSLAEIAYYSKFWERISDDGVTSNSSYGNRVFGKHKSANVDQWEHVKAQLLRDSHSRRAVIHISFPSDLRLGSKDQPCTLSWQFLIRENKLHMLVNMRSNDLVLGLPYDVGCFTLFQEKMLLELQANFPQLKMGNYYHMVASMHLYERDIAKLPERQVEDGREVPQMPRMQNLEQLSDLQYNEERIRLGQDQSGLRQLDDKFCAWCQNILLGEQG